MVENDKKRIYMLDELRGFAILCMVVHHFFLDIGVVLGFSWGYEIFDALCVIQPLFWAIFIIISGICSRLSRNTTKRGIIVFLCGLAVTFVTAVIMPKLMGIEGEEIYFGILSCLGSCMIITGLLMPLINKMNEKVGMIIFAFLFLATYSISGGTLLFGLIDLPSSLYQNNLFAPLGFYSDTFHSADYFAIIPWVFLFIFGSFIGKFAKENSFPKVMYKKHSGFLCFVGRNSLWVYLLHQIVLYGILYIVTFIMVLIFI